MATNYIYGYRPVSSPMYFYISISKDPQSNFIRDISQEKNDWGRALGNKEVHKRINLHNKQVKLDILASTDDMSIAYNLRNFLLYYCQKTAIFHGNHLTKANFCITRDKLKSLFKNGEFNIVQPIGCFADFQEINIAKKVKKLNNWQQDKEIPKDCTVVEGYVIPKALAMFMPPVECILGDLIYISEDRYWNLQKHRFE